MLINVKTTIKRGIVGLGIPAAIAKFREPEVVVLRYHSVLDNPAEHKDSIGDGIIHSSSDFARQMEYLARTCHAVTLDQVAEFQQGRFKLPRRAVAITFDDGFADNLTTAIPIMNRCGVPGTIYMTAGYAAGIPWNCALRYIFMNSKRSSFTNPLDGEVKSLEYPGDRHRAFLACSRACASTPRAEIDGVIARLEAALDLEYRPESPIMLDWNGVREVLHQGHTIGSHTMTHPNLAYVSAEECHDQMVDAKRSIEKETGSTIRHFSYPSPIMEPHWTLETMETCRVAGYDTAVTCTDGAVQRQDPLLSMKRIFARISFEDFVWALENMFAGRIV